MSGEKKHAPTQKKLADARKEGQVARTKDVGAWLVVGGGVMIAPMVIERMTGPMRHHFDEALVKVAMDPTPQNAAAPLKELFLAGAASLIPLAALTVVLAILGTAIQGGINVAEKALKPKFDRLNPINGIKQMFSMKTLWEAAKSLLKTAILTGVMFYTISSMVPALRAAGAISLGLIMEQVVSGVATIVQIAVTVGLILAVVDYIVTKKQMYKKLRMSDQDLKDEHKQQEGDPLLKGAIKSRQIAMSRNRMMAEVAEADVVMVNPVHIAVAVKYDPANGAPKVVAKGQGLVANKIKELAAENSIPTVEDVPLARALYYSCELGQNIPIDLYNAVATVLAFVMKLKQSGGVIGVQSVPGGAPDVPPERTIRHLPRKFSAQRMTENAPAD